VQIDGLSGTGKSTLAHELSRRGYRAVDADALFAYFADPVTGAPTNDRVRANWKWDGNMVRSFAAEVGDDTVFVCGGALNGEEFAQLFRRRFALVIDDASMRQRLLTRTNNDYGKDPAELAEQLELNKSAAVDARDSGWIVIDATQPTGKVADDILRLTYLDDLEPNS
jgi:gluconate kinase